MKRDFDFTDVPYTEVKPQPEVEDCRFVDGLIVAVCGSILGWTLIIGLVSWAFNLNL